jgi:hypothetical protein
MQASIALDILLHRRKVKECGAVLGYTRGHQATSTEQKLLLKLR